MGSLLLALVAVGPALGAPAPLPPGPVPVPLAPATHLGPLSDPAPPEGLTLSAESCGECHPAALESWRSSRHSVATSNAIFQAAWLAWPNGWCLTCHAPLRTAQQDLLGHIAVPGVLSAPTSPPPDGLWTEGVTCTVCHLGPQGILSAGPPSAAALAVHPTTHDPTLGTAEHCATCHQFPFQHHTPRWPFAYGHEPSQDTLNEWRSSTHHDEGRTCTDCHMGPHDHRMPGAHDTAFVRKILTATVRQDRHGEVHATVRADGAGHRVPTGDPFRALELELCVDAACTEVEATLQLRRTFRATESNWRLDKDTTIPPPRSAETAARQLSSPLTRQVSFFRLRYRFGDPTHEPILSAEDVGYEVLSGPVTQEER